MKFNDTKNLQESTLMKGLELAESAQWRDYSASIREGYRRKNKKSIPNDLLATTAQLLENTRQYAARMDETTREVNLGNFVDYGFDVISAVVPSLIAPEIMSVQAMQAKHGAIFYLQYLYGSNKGQISAGDVMNSPFTGAAPDYNYSNDVIDGEILGTGDASAVTFTTSMAYTPMRPATTEVYTVTTLGVETKVAHGTGVVTNGVEAVAADNTSGVVVADSSINLGTGAVTIKFGTAPAAGTSIVVKYRYNMDQTEVAFSQVDLDLKSVSIEAFPRKLRARWLLDAAYEMKQMKGIDAENELVVAMSSEIKHEIDGELLMKIYQQAGNTGYTWDAQNPKTNLSYQEYKRTIIDVLTTASNDIFTQTKRVGANWIVGGVNFCTIVETLEEFVPETLGTKVINGPHLIGTLCGKWKIYKNPFYGDNNFVLGYKGDSYLDAGFVYAPYMPLYTTPTYVTDDFIFRKGLATSYGQIMLNNKLYAKGSITNFSSTRYQPSAE